MSTEQEIQQRLKVLAPLHMELHNDSHLHAGHAGNTGGGHYRVLVVSDVFVDQSRLNRQRMVKDQLYDLFPNRIHALSIRALSSDEYFSSNQNPPFEIKEST